MTVHQIPCAFLGHSGDLLSLGGSLMDVISLGLRAAHYQALSLQPGDDNLIIRHRFHVPLQSPDVVKPHFLRRTIHKRHVDGQTVPIQANPRRVVIPFAKVGWILPLPPIFRRRRRITVCPGAAFFSFVFTAYRIGTIPGAVGNHRDIRGVF